ncbi:MAG: YfaZ family outer membrane protein [Gammaproteobacteria bacterium]|nr:YfaZ family outer membrane protein [Gammaproteobacteria bacterium]
MQHKILIITALLVPATNVAAGAIDFRVGKDMAELSYYGQTSSFGYGGADMGLGVLFNDDKDVIANGSILVSGSSSGDVKALHFGVGAKVYGGDISGSKSQSFDVQGGAVAIGGQIRYIFPSSTPFAVLGEVFYAPEVTNIADWDRTQEYRVALELEVSPSARAYVGYRKLEVKFDSNGSNHNYDVDDGLNIGVRFEF